MNEKKNILICPLEWGLGHSARMVPLAKRLLELNQNIIFGAGEEHLGFLKNEVPSADFINFPGFRIRYSGFLPQYLIILLKTPLLFYHSVKEHQRLKKIIRDYSVDIVISDNRIGLWNRKVKTVFVTHQLRIPFPFPFRFLEFIGIGLVRQICKKFTFCLIPDLPGEINISGRLSHGFRLPDNAMFIGIISRFSNHGPLPEIEKDTVLVMLSGPEPQKTILQNKIIKALRNQNRKVTILEGRTGNPDVPRKEDGVIFYKHLSSDIFSELIRKSETLISRSGYTTLMELMSLGKSGLIIPTPGQTEQEYLAEYLSEKGWFTTIRQKDTAGLMNFLPANLKSSVQMTGESKLLLDLSLKAILEK